MAAYLTQITNYLLTQSWQIAVLVAVITTVSFLLKNRSAHIRYLLWLIVLAKCLVPPLFAVPLAVLPWEEPVLLPSPALRQIEMATPEPTTSQPELITAPVTVVEPQRKVRLTPDQALTLLWMTGAAVFLLTALVKALRTNRWLKGQRRVLSTTFQAKIEGILAGFGLKRLGKIWLIEGIGQPFVWGLLRGSIYLPADFIKIDSSEHRRDVLGHEVCHILRFDAAVNFLQVISQAIFWFHPFVWWANKKIRAEREKCCDEMTIARMGAKVKDYSSAILQTLIAEHKSTRPVPSLAVAGPVKNIEERIKTMLRPGKKFYKRPSLMVAAVVLLLALLTVPTALVLTARAQSEAITEPEEKPSKSLHEAAESGDLAEVKRLIAQGADVNASDGDEVRTPLLAAADGGHAEVVKLLLKNGAKVDMGDSYGYTPLYYAIWSDDEAAVKSLVSSGADVNTRPSNEKDYPPLAYAIWQWHKGNVEILLDAGADINTKDEKGYTPLYWAAFSSSKDVLDLILAKGDYPNTIHLAACKGDLDRVKTLIERGTNIDIKDEFGCVPLHWAALAESPEVADFLIGKGADVNAKDARNLTPLIAARGLPVIKLLVSKGADIQAQDSYPESTKLHWACIEGDKDVVEFLISKGAEVDRKNKRGQTPLWLAASYGHREIVELLIKKGANINVSNNRGLTPLAMARQRKQNEVVDILLKHGAVETLHGAAASGNIDEIKRLLSQGTDINAQNERGQTPLQLALNSDQMEVAELLVANGANVDAIDGQTGKAMLLSVGGRKERVEFLLSKSADIEAKDDNGLTLLNLMATYSNQKDYLDVVELLLEKGADIEKRGYGDCTTLQAVASVGRKEAAEFLLAHGAKLDAAPSKFFGTVVHLAMKSGHRDMVRWCLSNGLDIPPLHKAAYFGETDKVQSLLNKGTNVNQKDVAEFTPLHCAVLGRNQEVVQLLIENGADIEAENCANSTPLFCVCDTGYLDMVKLLVDKGAEVDSQGFQKMAWGPAIIDKFANLHIAAYMGRVDIAEYLIDKGADIHARCIWGDDDLTPLHLAAGSGRVDVVKALLAKGADVNLKSKEGRTALDFARRKDHTDVVELLRKHGAKG